MISIARINFYHPLYHATFSLTKIGQFKRMGKVPQVDVLAPAILLGRQQKFLTRRNILQNYEFFLACLKDAHVSQILICHTIREEYATSHISGAFQ